MIRVLLVDDDALVRSGLRIMLAGAANLDVVAEAADGREVLGAVDLHRPDVVLMDIRMPELDGIAATRLLGAQPDPPAVLVLTTFDADELVLRALRAGAAGFLLKDTPPAEIVRARGRARGGPRVRERRHRGRAAHERRHGEGARVPAARQARRREPRPD